MFSALLICTEHSRHRHTLHVVCQRRGSLKISQVICCSTDFSRLFDKQAQAKQPRTIGRVKIETEESWLSLAIAAAAAAVPE